MDLRTRQTVNLGEGIVTPRTAHATERNSGRVMGGKAQTVDLSAWKGRESTYVVFYARREVGRQANARDGEKAGGLGGGQAEIIEVHQWNLDLEIFRRADRKLPIDYLRPQGLDSFHIKAAATLI